jgi:hypothetical protein
MERNTLEVLHSAYTLGCPAGSACHGGLEIGEHPVADVLDQSASMLHVQAFVGKRATGLAGTPLEMGLFVDHRK